MGENAQSHSVTPAVNTGSQGAAMPRVYLECTYTWACAGNTGIQRVVRNITNHAGAVATSMGTACHPAVLGATGWRTIAYLAPEPAPAVETELLSAALLRRARGLAMRLPRPFKGLLFFHRVKQPLRSAVWRIGNFLATWRDRSSDRGLNFTKGDILVLLDSSWHVPIWPGVIRAKQQGARVGVVLYDLVPLLMPDCCVPELVSAFNEWLGQAVRHADFFVCISRTVAEEAREQLTRRYGEIRSRRPAFGSFRLGADLDLAETRDKVRPALRAAFEQPQFRRVYITVGTVEPRKNHAYLLDAFERTWARGSDASLCIVGKEGWKCAAVLQRIRTHVELGRRLFMFHDLSDGELTYCYRHAGAVILPSKAEGFGLPVVEALRLGCRVWVSDLPIFHEVGGDFCCYFDLGSPDALARLLATDVDGSLASLVRSPAHFRWPNWRESCAELLERVRELAG